jgi:hypothetical protein
VSGRPNGSGRGRESGHGGEFPHAHDRSVGGRGYRHGCARHGYDHYDRYGARAARRVNANGRDLVLSVSRMIRGIGS